MPRRLGSFGLSVTPYFSWIILRPALRLSDDDSGELSSPIKSLITSVKSFSSLIVSSASFLSAFLSSVIRIGNGCDARSNVLSSKIRLKGIGSSHG